MLGIEFPRRRLVGLLPQPEVVAEEFSQLPLAGCLQGFDRRPVMRLPAAQHRVPVGQQAIIGGGKLVAGAEFLKQRDGIRDASLFGQQAGQACAPGVARVAGADPPPQGRFQFLGAIQRHEQLVLERLPAIFLGLGGRRGFEVRQQPWCHPGFGRLAGREVHQGYHRAVPQRGGQPRPHVLRLVFFITVLHRPSARQPKQFKALLGRLVEVLAQEHVEVEPLDGDPLAKRPLAAGRFLLQTVAEALPGQTQVLLLFAAKLAAGEFFPVLDLAHGRLEAGPDHAVGEAIEPRHGKGQPRGRRLGVGEFLQQREGLVLMLGRPRLGQQRAEQLAGDGRTIRLRRPADLLAEKIQHLGPADVGKHLHERLAESILHRRVRLVGPAPADRGGDLLPILRLDHRVLRRDPGDQPPDLGRAQRAGLAAEDLHHRLADPPAWVAVVELIVVHDVVGQIGFGGVTGEEDRRVGQRRLPPFRLPGPPDRHPQPRRHVGRQLLRPPPLLEPAGDERIRLLRAIALGQGNEILPIGQSFRRTAPHPGGQVIEQLVVTSLRPQPTGNRIAQ